MDCGYNKNTKVPDVKFPTPEILNKIPCTGSDRYLVAVPELIEIIDVCQDESNPSIVYIDFKLNGVYNFTPTLFIKKVDEDDNYAKVGVTAPIVRSYWRSNPKLENINYIFTACKTQQYTLAFDFGSVIPEFLGSNFIDFVLRMDGVLPPELDLPDSKILNKTIEDRQLWNKGPIPNPLKLEYNPTAGKLIFYFEFEDSIPCTCNITCKTLQGNTNSIQYCEDKVSRIVVDYVGGESIDDLLLTFTDAVGNTATLNIEPTVDLTPLKPTLVYLESPRRVELSIKKETTSGRKLKNNTAYQIWRYEGSLNNVSIWKDWAVQEPGTFVDMSIIPGKRYGYAVRYKGEYGDVSKLSDWEVVSV